MKIIEETKKKQREAVRELMSEIHGTTMDYASCSMLEEFFNTYTDELYKQMELGMIQVAEEIKFKFDLVPKPSKRSTEQ